MNNFNIDIHCHGSTRPFLSGLKVQKHKIMEDYDFEIESNILDSIKEFLEEISQVRLHTQSNIDNLFKGNVRVAFISITPIEKGFCIINQLKKPKGILAQLLKSNEKDNTISENVINALTGFSNSDLRWVKYKMTDYFTEYFLEELNYLTQFEGQVRNVGNQNYVIRFPKNNTELEKNLKDESIMNLIITVEGDHSFVPAPINDHLINNQNKNHLNSSEKDEVLCSKFIENIAVLKQQNYVPIFTSLNHHFWNQLGGHARSITKLITDIISQDEGLNAPLNENGKVVLKELLGTHNGKRILIDIKHMSPRCRKNYYELLDKDFKNDLIPIIASHTGVVSKWETLVEMIGINDDNELKNNRNYLHEQTINICKEDIKRIHDSKGIIGLQLDEKRIMGHKTLTKLSNRHHDNTNIYCEILWINIFQIIRSINKKTAWDIIAIGSDYDGMINHLDLYPTEADFTTLKLDMMTHLARTTEFDTKGFNLTEFTKADLINLRFGYSIDVLIDKIFSQNALDFLKRNF